MVWGLSSNALHNAFLPSALQHTPPLQPPCHYSRPAITAAEATVTRSRMSWLFGSSKTPQEIIREHQRTLQRSMRELDRERVKLEQQEVKLKNDIKKSAKAGQMVSEHTRPAKRAHEGRNMRNGA